MRRKCIMVTSIYIPGTLKRMHLQHEMDRNPRCKPIHWKHQGLAVTVLAPSQRATVQIAPGRLEAYPFAIFPYTYGFGVSGASLSETTDLSSICVDWQAKSGMSSTRGSFPCRYPLSNGYQGCEPAPSMERIYIQLDHQSCLFWDNTFL